MWLAGCAHDTPKELLVKYPECQCVVRRDEILEMGMNSVPMQHISSTYPTANPGLRGTTSDLQLLDPHHNGREKVGSIRPEDLG